MPREVDYCQCRKRRPVVSREGDYYKCSKRRAVVWHEKATITSVERGSQWYVTRMRLLLV